MTTKNVNWMKQARKIITKHLKEASVRENIDRMLENMNKVSREFNIEHLEQIDSDITNAMLRGAKAYTNFFSVWWSPTLHHAYLETKYWKLRRIQAATHVSMKNAIAQVLAKLPDTSEIHAKHHALHC